VCTHTGTLSFGIGNVHMAQNLKGTKDVISLSA
jgi:hypothetical protein